MTPTPAMHLEGKSQPGWFGLTMHSASGSASPGKWWSVTNCGDAELGGAGHALNAGDAVIDGHDEVGRHGRGEVDHRGREAVAVH